MSLVDAFIEELGNRLMETDPENSSAEDLRNISNSTLQEFFAPYLLTGVDLGNVVDYALRPIPSDDGGRIGFDLVLTLKSTGQPVYVIEEGRTLEFRVAGTHKLALRAALYLGGLA